MPDFPRPGRLSLSKNEVSLDIVTIETAWLYQPMVSHTPWKEKHPLEPTDAEQLISKY